MKRLFAFSSLLFLFSALSAQEHQRTLVDSTFVVMEESGLSHVTTHKRILVNDFVGCRNNAVIKLDYDPQSAFVEFRSLVVSHADGRIDTLLPNPATLVYDYVAPARLIYWGASQKMVEVPNLNPGDVIDYVSYRKGFTYALLADDDSRFIPPMRGHFYDIVPFWSDHPVLSKVYTISVPITKRLQFKVYNDTALSIDSSASDNLITYTFTKNNIQPLHREPNALANNDIQCKLLLSTAPDWQAKSRWFYNVNEDYGSFRSTPEVQLKVNTLLADARSEMDSISILTHWVADNIRYAGVSMGQGEGYTLHNAEMNFSDRCGVCKDKASMLITMLRAAGFEAYAAMTMAHERIDDIPADQFNHSVCAVRLHDGQYLMLDPTWVPNVRELWSSAEQQQGYLIGSPQGATLMYTPLSAPENHYIRITGNTAIDNEGTLSGTISITAEGQSDAAVRRVFNAPQSMWRSNLEAELLRIAPNAVITDIKYSDPDRYLDHPVSISYSFTIPHYAVVERNTIAFIPLSARNFFSRAMSHLFVDVSSPTRSQPFADNCSRLVEISETVQLPRDYQHIHFPMVSGVAHPAASFGCQYWVENSKLSFAESLVFSKRLYEASDWPMFRHAVLNQKLLATTPVIITTK